MKRKPQVLSVGEVLVDFICTESGVTLQCAPQFVKCAGGAPANVAVGIARLGTRSAFAGNVGDDSFGRFLISELTRAGVDASGVVLDPDHRTRLAFVSVMKNGNRDFEFWERHPADVFLKFSDICTSSLARSRIVNIGSFLLLRDPSRKTAMRVAQAAKAMGCDVCYDPNLRLALWEDRNEGRRIMAEMLQHSTIVRLNDDEAAFFTGTRDLQNGACKIRSIGPELVVITRAAKGCYFQTRTWSGYVPGFIVEPVDTTGCGDGFLAGLLHGLAQSGKGLDQLSCEELRGICVRANAVGALVATKRGAINAMPSAQEVELFLQKTKSDRL